MIIAPLALAFCLASLALMLFDTAFTAVGSAAGAAVGYLGYSLLLNQLSTGIILLTHDLTYWIW